MSFPLYIVSGAAGSGKDTVAEMLCRGGNGVMIAQADPMKQFAQKVAGFTVDQLWGPSAMRNAEDPRFAPGNEEPWERMAERVLLGSTSLAWLDHIGASGESLILADWFQALRRNFKTRTLTPRAFLQTLGTEFGRRASKDLWSELAIRQARRLLAGQCSYDKEAGVKFDANNHGPSFVVITDGRFRNEILNVKAIGGSAIKIVNPVDESDTVERAGIKGHASEAEQKSIPDAWFSVVFNNNKKFGLENLRSKVHSLSWTLGIKGEL